MTPEFDRQFNQTMNQSWERSMKRREMEYNIIKLIQQGELTFPQIGERYGVSSRTISRIAAKHGIKGSTKPKSDKSLHNLVKTVKPDWTQKSDARSISSKDIPKLVGGDGHKHHDVKADGQSICPGCVRERPCSNCPNVLPTIADELNMRYLMPDRDKSFFRAEKNNHMIWIEDGFLNYKHKPSGSSSRIHIKDWKKIIEPLKKAVNAELEF